MNAPYDAQADPVIQALIAEAAADPDVIGLVLTGSRAVGAVTPESDYDLVFVVTDQALDRYACEHCSPVRGETVDPPISTADISHQSPRTLTLDQVVTWMLPAWAESRVLFDRTGESARIIDALRRMSPDRARQETTAWYDTYLNGLYRSLKSWRRGKVLEGRLEAAETANHLLHTLFALERHWRPFNSRLALHLDELTGQEWQAGELQAILLDLITTGDPCRQQSTARRITALLRDRGFGPVYDAWDGKIDQALAWTYE